MKGLARGMEALPSVAVVAALPAAAVVVGAW
jgi:hypothetical protein